ncbi:glycosyl hydrolase family protein [Clostridiales bacterium COT073_COT-073]|nr:glycosyl hydrolase family protein [Clostridiales bacterium COT073_COT-073]
MKSIREKILAIILTLTILFSSGASFQIWANEDENLENGKTPVENLKKTENVLLGKIPTTNNEYDEVLNLAAATDGVKDQPMDNSKCMEIKVGQETGNPEELNGYENWNHSYIQYDIEEIMPIKEIRIYRNAYENAISTFKKVKVEISTLEDFSESEIIYDLNDYKEKEEAKGEPQVLVLDETKEAQYVRIWGQGHYIENTNSSWKGYSNALRFHEIEVITETEEYPQAPEEPNDPEEPKDPEEMVDINILKGKLPTTNAIHNNGTIKNPKAATDGISQNSADDSQNTEITVGEETGNEAGDQNGYANWQHAYLQYDFGKLVPVKEVKIYRNSFPNAFSQYKKVKVELSETADFTKVETIFAEKDVEETAESKGQPQIIKVNDIKAQYIRIWGQGHYIQNISGNWKGHSNALRFHEIEVTASVPKSEAPEEPQQPQEELKNIAAGKLPYVYGLEPTDIAHISDGNWTNLATHNSKGEHWLQFEYKNAYPIKKINFKLAEGRYDSVKITVSHNPQRNQHHQGAKMVFNRNNFAQGSDMTSIVLPEPVNGRCIRFLVKKSNDEPTQYSEIEIWSTNDLHGEERPIYKEPVSKYNKLVWQDDFNEIDEQKWNIIEGMANHGAIYNRKAVSILEENGNKYLAINSKNYETKERLIDEVGLDDYGDREIPDHVTWSSGRLESKNKFAFQFGRMATRAKVNDSQGVWPAIWMLCQDETGHDEIDVLEYLGQDAHGAWTTNHYGIWGKNKASHGHETFNYEAWCQDFHVYEVEWDPEYIKWFIDGVEIFRTTKGQELDSMHTRPMFPILETQVGDGWVGKVDFDKQKTKQDSNFLIDWIRVYQQEDQPVVRFDDLETLTNAKNNEYRIAAKQSSDGFIFLTRGSEDYENKNNFFYGGQPRYEDSRVAVKEDAEGEQYIVYEVKNVKDVHLTAYYQTIKDKKTWKHENNAGYSGHSIREELVGNADIDFKIMTSKDGVKFKEFTGVKVVNNFIEVHPAYARTTFDAYDLPAETQYVKIVFPQYKGVQYRLKGQNTDVKNTDIQLAKVTFLQKQKEVAEEKGEANLRVFPSLRKYETVAGEFTPTTSMKMVIETNQWADQNARLQEVAQLVGQEFAAYEIPQATAMPIIYGTPALAQKGDILITLKDKVDNITMAEGFAIEVGDKIKIEATTANGVMYALRSVMQYLYLHKTMPFGQIIDYPETEERALHLDMGRKYFTADWIKNLIKELSFSRINTLQLHFSEHEGFRLECETYPDVMSEKYITKAEMRGIIAEAKKYGVEIIPSFDNPGHLRQALRNYPELWLEHVNGFKERGSLDINKAEAREFVKNIIKEYAELFVDSRYFHIGGDEFINFDEFHLYPSLKEFGQKHVKDGVIANEQDGYMAYINEIAEYTKDLGFIPRIWNDGIYRANMEAHIKLHDYIQICYWTRWSHNMASTDALLKKGFDLVNVNDLMYYVLTTKGRAYFKKPDASVIYNAWHVGLFSGRNNGRLQEYTLPHDKIKGATYAIWCDVPEVETEKEVSEGIFYSLRAMAEKSWAGKQEKGNYAGFKTLLTTLGKAPGISTKLPDEADVNVKDLIAVKLVAKTTNGQILGTTEVCLGKAGESYRFAKPEFKGFMMKSSEDELSGTFSENKTITVLFKREVSFEELKAALAKPLAEADYIAETFVEYKKQLEKAKQLIDNENATAIQVTKAVAAIRIAAAKVVKKEWQPLYERLQEAKPKEKYTKKSYEPYLRIFNNLKLLIQGPTSDTGKINEYINRLTEAENALQLLGDNVEISINVPNLKAYQTYTFDKIIDGDRNSFAWVEAIQEAGQEFIFEFSSPVVLSQVNLVYPSVLKEDYIGKGELQIKDDGEWQKVADISGNRLVREMKIDNKKVKMARILITGHKDKWTQIAEVEFSYKKWQATPPTPKPIDKTALRAMIVNAEQAMTTDRYRNATAEIKVAFEMAFKTAKEVEEKEQVDQDKVDAVTKDLAEKLAKLDGKPQPNPDPQPKPQPDPKPQPNPQAQPQPFVPYEPKNDTSVTSSVKPDIVIEDEATPLSSAEKERIKSINERLTNQADKNAVQKLIEKKIGYREFTQMISSQALEEYAKEVADSFVDEKSDNWYAKELSAIRIMGLFKGYPDGTFGGNREITGKELVTVLVRAGQWKLEKMDGDWFAPYQQAADKNGLLKEIDFDLSKAINRQEVAALAYNFIQQITKESKASEALKFSDNEKIDSKYQNAVAYLMGNGILKGYEDGTFRPQDLVKRQEVVAILYRLLKK